MLIRKAPDLTYADVTPKSVYLNRRNFLRAMGIVGASAVARKRLLELASPSEMAFAGTKLIGLKPSPFSTTEKQNSYQDVTHYNNFYEFGTDKGDPAKNAQHFKLDRVRRRRSEKASQIQHGRNSEARPARRTHLPSPLRRSVVHRRPLDRSFFQQSRQPRRAHAKGAIRRLPKLLRHCADAPG